MQILEYTSLISITYSKADTISPCSENLPFTYLSQNHSFFYYFFYINTLECEKVEIWRPCSGIDTFAILCRTAHAKQC